MTNKPETAHLETINKDTDPNTPDNPLDDLSQNIDTHITNLEKMATLSDLLDDRFNLFPGNSGQDLTDQNFLANELLNSYNHLNTTFSATLRVALCKNLPEAIYVLLEEILTATDSCLALYLGRDTDDFHDIYDSVEGDHGVIVHAAANTDKQDGKAFFHKNWADLTDLYHQDESQQFKMIDYPSDDDPDYEGRGNVLAIRLGNEDAEQKNLGMLVFVRQAEKVPFEAVEMNLASSLCRLGSAVLGNILYAQKIGQMYLQIITSLVRAMEAKDPYTSGHSVRVAELACCLARYIGLDEDEIEQVNRAGQLHDIGKIGIKDEILTKPGRLTDEEFDHIKTHPETSYKVLEPLDAMQGVIAAVRHHHEHYDGSGYPDGLKGEDIPLHARILQIADIWDALTSTRSYRKAMPPEKAREIMAREAGATMDPYLVDKFLEMLETLGQDSNEAIMF